VSLPEGTIVLSRNGGPETRDVVDRFAKNR
jgi:hypothetical protein